MTSLPGYDAWKLASPDDDRDEVGEEDGQTCNRFAEPDEDAPRKRKGASMTDWRGEHLIRGIKTKYGEGSETSRLGGIISVRNRGGGAPAEYKKKHDAFNRSVFNSMRRMERENDK